MNQNVGPEFPTAAREAADIKARLDHMDELGVDMHILYPTMFLRPLTNHSDTDYAISRSYNRWLADVWEQGGGRLRWAVIPPLMNMDKAIEEVHFGKEHGACAVFFRGHEHNLILSDPYFFPVYEEAQKLNLAIAVHAAAGQFANMDLYDRSFGLPTFKFPTVGAFSDLVLHRVPERFPDPPLGVHRGHVPMAALRDERPRAPLAQVRQQRIPARRATHGRVTTST